MRERERERERERIIRVGGRLGNFVFVFIMQVKEWLL